MTDARQEAESKITKARREYYRAWRAKNPEKVRKYQENYWKRQAEKKEEAAYENADNQ